MDYKAYEECFNTGDDDELVRRFFHDDVILSGGSRDCIGKDELLGFLRWAHDGVREVMRPQKVLQDESHIFAEVDMDFHATKERPEFPFGPLRPGDRVTVKFFVTYFVRDGKVAQLKSMTWPPGKGVTNIPRLGPHPSQVAAFHSYVAAFGNADVERFTAFYNEEVVLQLGPAYPPLHGPEGIAGFYRPMFARVREKLTIHSVEASETAIALDATTRFTAIADAPDFVIRPLAKGEYIEGRVLVDYALRNGRISKISVRRNGEMEMHREGE